MTKVGTPGVNPSVETVEVGTLAVLMFEALPIFGPKKSKSYDGAAVGPCGNCGKRFVLSKPLWESAF